MSQKFTVQILTDKEFDSLPYKGISDSLGIADKEKGFAFVRNTGVKEFDLATLSHEIDHLVSKNTTHEDEYGIAHKKGGFFRQIAAPIAGILGTLVGGPGLGALAGAAAGAGTSQYAKSKHPEQLGEPGKIGDILGSATMGGLSGYGAGNLAGGALAGGKAAAPGFLSKASGIAKGGLLGTPAVSGISAGGGGVGAAPAGVSTFTPATPGLLGKGGSFLGAGTPASKVAGEAWATTTPNMIAGLRTIPLTGAMAPGAMSPEAAMSLRGGGIGDVAGNPVAPMDFLGKTQTVAPAVAQQTTPPTTSILEKVGDFAKNNPTLLGAGLTGASLLPKTPEFQMPDSVEQLRQKILGGEGISPLGQQARSELSGILKSSPTELYAPAKDEYYQAILRRTEDAYSQAQEQLDAAYNAAGVYGSGEHLAAKDKLNKQLTNAKTDLYATTEQRNFELARTEKYQAIQDSLGVDRGVMDDLVGLTGMDVQQAANVYNAKAEDVQAIREALGTLGVELVMKGSGINKNTGSGININVGGGNLGG